MPFYCLNTSTREVHVSSCEYAPKPESENRHSLNHQENGEAALKAAEDYLKEKNLSGKPDGCGHCMEDILNKK